MNTPIKLWPVTEPQIERFRWMWCVRLADRETKVNGQKAYVRNHLSTDGKSVRMFISKDQAEAWLGYYKELLVAREKFMEVQKEQEDNAKAQAIEGETVVEEQNNVDWPVPDDYDPSKVKGKIWTGQGVDEEVAREAAGMAEQQAANNQPQPWQSTTT